MTPPDPDPRYVEPDPLPRFREQRRRSRFGCSVALIAIVAALVVAWALIILFVATFVSAVTAAQLDGLAMSPAMGPPEGAAAVASDDMAAGWEPSLRWESIRAVPEVGPSTGDSVLSTLTYTGTIGFANASHGSRYLAIPNGPGWLVEVCGPASCLTRTSTDAGPDLAMQRAGRIADVSAADFPVLCGVPTSYGLCPGTVLVLGRARLPDTSTESIASSGFGMHGAPRLEMTARCSSSGQQSVWVAQTGTAFLDIVQVGTMDGEFFYAYGRGEPGGVGSLYVEEHLGPSGTGPHRYGVELAAPSAAPENRMGEAAGLTLAGAAAAAQGQRGAPPALVAQLVEHRPDAARSLGSEVAGSSPAHWGGAPIPRVWTLTIDGRVVATVPDTFRNWRLRATQVMAEGDLPFGAAACSFPAGSWHFGGYGPQPGYAFGAREWRVST